jgi:hypothetical protein
MSLDLEGAEESVMRSFPFDAFSIDVLTIERPPAALHTQLVELGYCVNQGVLRHPHRFLFVFVCVCLCVSTLDCRAGASYVGRPICVCAV